MGRSAATSDRTATAVKQQQLDLLGAADFHQFFLSPVLRPGSGGGAGILGRVGVADHDFLRAMQAQAITGQAEQMLDHRACVIQVGQGFEQGHDAHRPLQSSFLEQQLHRQHIGCRACHGNNVRAQGGCGRSGHLTTGRQHFGGIGSRFEMRGQQRPLVIQLAQQEFDARLLVPFLVTPQAQIVGNFGHRRAMTGRVLTHIELDQEQPKSHRTTQTVEQRTVSDHAHAALMQ